MERTIGDDTYWLCRLLHDNLQLPVRLLRNDHTVEAVFDSEQARHPLDPDSMTVLAGIFADDSLCDKPCYSKWNGFDQYVWLRFGESCGRIGAIVIGPATSSIVTDKMLEGFLYDNSISGIHLDSLREYYRQLPVRYQKSMLHAGTLLYYLVYRQPIDVTEVIDCSVPFHRLIGMNEVLERSLTDRRLNLNFHHHLNAVRMLMQCVKEGRKEEIVRYYDLIPRENAGVLSRRSQIRNEKNLAICVVTHAMQAAIDGGLYREVAFTASDLWIQHIEDLHYVEEVAKAIQEVLFDFAERVSRQRVSRCSKPVAVCQNYIFNRIYEPIKLTELAEEAGVHPAYLSKLFKQETGMTVSEYIHRQKVEEAKKMLDLTNESPLEVASLLNFHDQSHFTKVFKKYAGITPKQYKDRAV
ncbi:AraC family transcriptional regulator [Paenibacillus sp. KQZ6P-2]|uniref:AraC family transcriptional regulator n=1 Tax=Paenibacillus mangrovi TaxID=2931978 RepID=A0A9X1WW06_9BACL|nr:helix-turn-helix domain-containing protein [Paenibacillus mangrovi]MCJ8014578.1 AraC family transcriptional regulator [Paenibacillus mangrovi]